jgi:hypothetical protein
MEDGVGALMAVGSLWPMTSPPLSSYILTSFADSSTDWKLMDVIEPYKESYKLCTLTERIQLIAS